MTRISKSCGNKNINKKRTITITFSPVFPNFRFFFQYMLNKFKWAYLGVCPFAICPLFCNFKEYAHLQYAHFFENS